MDGSGIHSPLNTSILVYAITITIMIIRLFFSLHLTICLFSQSWPVYVYIVLCHAAVGIEFLTLKPIYA